MDENNTSQQGVPINTPQSSAVPTRSFLMLLKLVGVIVLDIILIVLSFIASFSIAHAIAPTGGDYMTTTLLLFLVVGFILTIQVLRFKHAHYLPYIVNYLLASFILVVSDKFILIAIVWGGIVGLGFITGPILVGLFIIYRLTSGISQRFVPGGIVVKPITLILPSLFALSLVILHGVFVIGVNMYEVNQQEQAYQQKIDTNEQKKKDSFQVTDVKVTYDSNELIIHAFIKGKLQGNYNLVGNFIIQQNTIWYNEYDNIATCRLELINKDVPIVDDTEMTWKYAWEEVFGCYLNIKMSYYDTQNPMIQGNNDFVSFVSKYNDEVIETSSYDSREWVNYIEIPTEDYFHYEIKPKTKQILIKDTNDVTFKTLKLQ